MFWQPKKGDSKLGRSNAFLFFIILFFAAFLLFKTPSVQAANDYGKQYNGTLSADEWNRLRYDFLNTFTNATATGPIGIGTSSPLSGLLVDGNIQTNTSFLGLHNAGYITAGAFGSYGSGGNYSFPSSVGIGNMMPSYRLYVAGTSATDAVRSEIGYDIFPVPAPTAPTGTVSAGGSVDTGYHYYLVTYVTALGETNSALSAQITTTAGNNTVNLNIPVSSDSRVIARKIYRTKANTPGSSDYLLATVSNNTATTYTDTAADSSLSGAVSIGYFRTNTTSNYITVGGVKALMLDTNLTSLGISAGASMTSGGRSSFFGYKAGYANTSGVDNQFFGYQAGYMNSTGGSNIAMGYSALLSNTGGSLNSALGHDSLFYNQTGSYNTALGAFALFGSSSQSHSYNTAIGTYAGYKVTTGGSNSFLGYAAGNSNTSGANNVLLGYGANYYNQTGSNNIAIGYQAGWGADSNSKSNNVMIGYQAGYSNLNGSGNLFLGYQAGYSETGSNKLYISNSNTTNPLIYGDFSNSYLSFNGSVAIGSAATSSYPLYVNGNAKFINPVEVATPINANHAATKSYVDSLSNPSGPSTSTAGYWTGNGANGIYNNNSGNVGIGTTAPSSKLEVAGNIKLVSSSDKVQWDSNGWLERDSIFAGGNYHLMLDSNNNSTDSYFSVRKDSQVVGGGTELFRIQEDGNVGIGTTSPSEKLEINGKLKLGNNTVSGENVTFDGAYNGQGMRMQNAYGYITMTPLNSGWAHIYTDRPNFIFNQTVWTIGGGGFSSYYNENLVLKTGGTVRVTIASSTGNVGIGYTTPGYTLDANTASGDAYNRFQASGATQNVGITLGRNGLNQWYMYSPANTTDFRISGLAVTDPFTIKDTTGNVGIGTTNPSKKLEVAGDTLITTTGSSQPFKTNQATYLNFSVDYPSSPSIYTTQINFGLLGRLQYDGNGGVMNIENRSTQSGSSMRFVMGTTERLRITDTGNLGIGTTNPTSILEVGGNHSDIGGITTRAAIVANSNSIQSFQLENLSSGVSAEMRFLTRSNDGNYMAFTSPSSANNGTFFGATKSTGNFIFSSARPLYIGTISDSDILFGRNNSTISMVIKGVTGNVGIGTTTPTTATLVIGNSSTNYSIDAGNYRIGNVATPVSNLDAVNKSYVDSINSPSGPSTSTAGYWTGNGANGIYNNNSGNVGIGTTAPAGKLEIAGRVYQSGLGNSTLFGYESGKNDDGSTRNNSAFGYQALLTNTSGQKNVAIGHQSLYSNNTGFSNTAVGYQTLYSGTGASINNVAVGYQALYSSTGSMGAVAVGAYALSSLGGAGTAVGYQALASSTTSGDAFGYQALMKNTSGYGNVAMGSYALSNNTTGSNNTSLGALSSKENISGHDNTSVGYYAGGATTGNFNTTVGSEALEANTTGSGNTALGYFSMSNNDTGSNNTAVGNYALWQAGVMGSPGSNNTVVGYQAGQEIWTGSNNTILGANITAYGAESNRVIIGDGSGNQRIYVNANGYVGLNNTSPGYILDTATSTGDAYNRFQAGSATQNVGTVLGRNGLNQWYMYSPANTTDFRISGLAVTDPFTIKDTTGNIGIGTTNPKTKLQISSDNTGVTGRGTFSLVKNEEDYGLFAGVSGNGDTWMQTRVGGSATYYNLLLNPNGGKVGIGVTNPGFALDVQGSSPRIQVKSTGTGYALLQASSAGYSGDIYFGRESSTGGNLATGSTGYSGVYNVQGTNPSYFAVNNGIVMTMLNGGNVGVGTTNPVDKLDVNGTIRAGSASSVQGSLILAGQYSGLQYPNTFGGYYGSAATIIGFAVKPKNGSAGYVSSADNIAWNRGAISLDGGFHVLTGGAQSVAIGSDVSMTEKFTVLNGGNVGIGTANPTTATLVIGTSSTNYSIDAGNYRIGNVATPISNLDAANKSYVDSVSNPVGASTSTAGYWTGNGANGIYNNNSGNVGIGTTNPVSKLNIVSNAGDAHVTLSNINSATSSYVTYSLQNIAQQWQIGLHGDTSQLRIRNATNSTYPFVINTNGNVGIGTTNPTALFHVGSSFPTIRFTQIDSSGQLISNFNNNGNSAPISIRNLDVTAGIAQSVTLQSYFGRTGDSTPREGGYLRFGKEQEWTSTISTNDSFISLGVMNNYSYNDAFRISATGNVGIGYTSPGYVLDTNTASGDAYNRFQAGSATQNVGTVLGRNGLNQWYMYSPANTTDFRISGLAVTDPFTIKDTTGYVGIGTTNPTSLLHISKSYDGSQDDLAPQVKVINPSTTAGQTQFSFIKVSTGTGYSGGYPEFWMQAVKNSSGVAELGIRGVSNTPLYFWTNNTRRMVIDASGNVGIGLTNPSTALQVNGTVTANAFSGNLTGIVNAINVSSGIFGYNTGMGGYAFPDKLAIGWGGDISSNPVSMLQTADLSVKTSLAVGATSTNGVALKVVGDTVITGSLQTQTGADFAEEFTTSYSIEPGTVVVMGDLGYKSVKPCEQKNDTTVVGVVSDNPSIIAGRVNTSNKAVIAMMGVVKVKVVSVNGTIRKGDLLTTSNISGYAMKADKNLPGTVIGKALEDLVGRKGEIKVLVNLQ